VLKLTIQLTYMKMWFFVKKQLNLLLIINYAVERCLKQVIKLNLFVQTRKSEKRNTVYQPNTNNNIFI
jgi:hypothetical protein